MPWFRVDDKLHDHRKARRAGKAAMGVWALAGSWAADNLTNGFVPASVLPRWGNAKDAAQLVAADLWSACEQDGEKGWLFHDWPEYQPTREEVEAERKATRERLRKWRENRRGNASGNGVTDGVANGASNAAPFPSLPDPVPSTSAQKRATRIPDDWKPTPEDVIWQREAGISDLLARRELPKFCDYWRAKAKDATKINWSLTWRNWLRTALEREPKAAASVPRYDGNGGW